MTIEDGLSDGLSFRAIIPAVGDLDDGMYMPLSSIF
jgi:hypothetical protein